MSSYPPPQNPQSATFNSSQWSGSAGNSSTYVTLSGAQNITGQKTFNANPVISQIQNVGTISIPTSTGTLALASQVVDLTSNQTVGGTKSLINSTLVASSFPAKTTTINAANMNFNLGITFPATFAADTLNETFILTNIAQPLFNKTLNVVKIGTSGTTFNQILTGTGVINFVAAAQYTQLGVAITFSPAFATTPQVQVSVSNNTSGQSSAVILQCGSITTTAFVAQGFYVFTAPFSGPVNFSWIAYA